MKLKDSTKRLLLLSALVLIVVTASGCSAPMKDGKVIQILPTTTFQETMSNENWFNAIFVWPLSQLLNITTPVIGVAGAIALVTLLVNGVLLIFTIKSTIATQQMQLLQPEQAKIQRKYEGRTDQASQMKQAQEMQALYKKYDVHPGGMLLGTFLQFPVIIAMYQAVQRSSAIATGTFLGMDLQVSPWTGVTAHQQYTYLGLFLFMAVCQFFSMMLPQMMAKRKAEKEAAIHHRKPAETGKQGQMMMYYMLVMILVFGAVWPAAMTIYWAIYSLVNVLKTLFVQRVIDKRNAKKEGVVA